MKIIVGNKIIARTVRLAFFILPIVYVAEILGTTIHEVLGHGLSAVLLGGQFSGFAIKWDTMGWALADIPAGATVTYDILFSASGIIATTVCGMILWGLVFLFRRRPDIQLALLVGAFVLLIDGLDYVVWNAYYPSPPMGDVGKIILFYQVMEFPGFTVIRWVFLITGALLFACALFYFCTSIFVRVEALILNGGQYTGKSRILALLLFLALPGAYEYLSFDWNQIAPGIGRVPNVAGAMSIITVAAVLFWYRPRLKIGNSIPPITWHHMAVSGTCLLITIMSLAFWLNEGVGWEVHKEPRIIGPLAINGSGDLLVCGVDKDGVRKYYIIPLTHDDFDPFPLEFPGSDKCWGVAWRPSVEHDELLFITAEEKKQIKRFRISGSNISEISSYPVDPNLLVIHPVWNPGGSIIAFRISELLGGEYHGPYLGFSNDNGKTIHISDIQATINQVWVDDHRLYTALGGYSEDDNMVLSEIQLDAENMSCETKEVLRKEVIYLARQSTDGSVVYASGSKIFRDNTLLCQLPEDIGGLVRDDGFIACLSYEGQRIYLLNDKGEVINTIQRERRSILGMSAEHECLYLWARDRSQIYRYNFVEKSESTIFEVAGKSDEVLFVTPNVEDSASE
jgi:hypothetical protein